MKVLLTGGSGFIGHHVAKALQDIGAEITFLERLSFSGNLNRLTEIGIERGQILHHDLRAPIGDLLKRQLGNQFDFILHLAALTHVDRAIEDPLSAAMDNVVATTNILQFARWQESCRFFYFSTDEVFGPAPKGILYKEWDRYRSTNPYAAAKAGGEEMALAFQNTYHLPVIITHTMNVFGERQHPEKFIPSTISKVRDGELVTIHADATKTIPGSRFYIHASAVAEALIFLLKKGEFGEKYNIVGEREVDNLQLALAIADAQRQPLRSKLVDFHSSRPGHDLRYGLDGGKMRELGWVPKASFEASLASTVQWSLENPRWL